MVILHCVTTSLLSYALEVSLSNGRSIRAEFGPVAGLSRLETRVTLNDSDDEAQEVIVQDNIFRTIMGGVAMFAATGERPSFADDLLLQSV